MLPELEREAHDAGSIVAKVMAEMGRFWCVGQTVVKRVQEVREINEDRVSNDKLSC